MKKKLLSLTLALVLCFGLFVPAFAAGSDFTIENGVLTKYNGSSSSVTEIGAGAFWGCTSLTSVIIPDSVTEIGNFAFRGCTNLTSITIPPSVDYYIGADVFFDCNKLTDVV